MADPWAGRKGIDILADILRHTDAVTTRNLVKNLQAVDPRIATELKRRIFSFEDLSRCDKRGLTRLINQTNLRDLALALKGAPEGVLQKIALQMSRRAIEDLRDEIALLGPTPVSEVESARVRIINTARRLMNSNEMYVEKEEDGGWVR